MKDTDTKTLNETFIYEVELLVAKIKTGQAECVVFTSNFSGYKGQSHNANIVKLQINETMPEETK